MESCELQLELQANEFSGKLYNHALISGIQGSAFAQIEAWDYSSCPVNLLGNI